MAEFGATSRAARDAERRQKYHEADVVVVGAGHLRVRNRLCRSANQGRSVILLERWMHEPDRIVGELLQPGGVDALTQAGAGEVASRRLMLWLVMGTMCCFIRMSSRVSLPRIDGRGSGGGCWEQEEA